MNWHSEVGKMKKNISRFLAFLLFPALISVGCKVNDLSAIPEYGDHSTTPLSITLSPDGLPAPGSTFVAESGVSSVKLTWKHIQGAVEYVIYRSESEEEGFTEIGRTSTTTAEGVTYIDHVNLGEEGSRFYYYRVASVDRYGIVGIQSLSKDAVVSVNEFDAVIYNVKASDGTLGNSIELTWLVDKEADHFRIYRAEMMPDGSFSAKTFVGKAIEGTTGKLVFRDNQSADESQVARPGQVYHYWVTAVNAEGAQSLPDEEASDSGYILPAPASLTASMGTVDNQVLLKWDYDIGFLSRLSADLRPTIIDFMVFVSDIPSGVAVTEFSVGSKDARSYSFAPLDLPATNGAPYIRFFKIKAQLQIPGFGLIDTLYSNERKGMIVGSSALTPDSSFDIQMSSSVNGNSGILDLSWPALPAKESYEPVEYIIYRGNSADAITNKMKRTVNAADIGADGRYHFYDYAASFTREDGSVQAVTVETGKEYWYQITCIAADPGVPDVMVQGGMSKSLNGYVPIPSAAISGALFTDRVELAWEASTDPNITRYDLIKAFNDEAGDPVVERISIDSATLTYVDRDIQSGTRYSYSVEVAGLVYHGQETLSPATEPFDALVFPRPELTGLSAMIGAVGEGVPLNWTLPEGARQVKIFKSASQNDPDPVGVHTADANENSWIDRSADGSAAWYSLAAVYDNEGGTSVSLKSEPKVGYLLTSTRQLFVAPLYSGDSYTGDLHVSWVPVSGAEEYELGWQNLDTQEVSAISSISGTGVTLSAVGSTPIAIILKAVNVNGIGPESTAFEFTYSAAAASPVNVTVTDGMLANRIDISWEKRPGASGTEGFVIFRDGVELSRTDAVTFAWSDTIGNNLTESDRGSDFYYSVASIVSGTVGAQSPVVQGSLMANPASVNASCGLYSDKIRVTFPAVGGALEYRLYDAVAADQPLTDAVVTAGADKVTIDLPVSGDQLGVIRSLLAAVVDAEGSLLYSSPVEGYVIAPVRTVTASQADFINYIQLSWEGVENAQWYRVWYTTSAMPASSSDWNSFKVNLVPETIDGKKVYTCNHINAPKGEVLHYKVQAGKGLAGGGAIAFDNLIDSATGFMMADPTSIQFSEDGTVGGADSTTVTLSWNGDLIAPDSGSLEYVLNTKIGRDLPEAARQYSVGGEGVWGDSFSSLTPGTPVAFTLAMRRILADGTEVMTDGVEFSFTPLLNPPVFDPAACVDGAVKSGVDRPITLQWNNLDKTVVEGYELFRSRSRNNLAAYLKVNDITRPLDNDPINPTVMMQDHGEVVANWPEGIAGAYYYRLQAINNDGYRSGFSDCVELYKLPTYVDLTSVEASNKDFYDKIAISWDNLPGVDYYRINYRYNEDSFASDLVAVNKVINRDDTRSSFDLTHIGSNPIIPGPYHFWIVPYVSFEHNNGVRAEATIDQIDMSNNDRKGLLQMTDDQWVKEVLREMNDSAAAMGDFNTGELSTYWWDHLDKDYWHTFSDPMKLPAQRPPFHKEQDIKSSKLKHGDVYGEILNSGSMNINSYKGKRIWFKDCATRYMVLRGCAWNNSWDVFRLKNAAGDSIDVKTVMTRSMSEGGAKGNEHFGPVRVSGEYPGWLSLGKDGAGQNYGLTLSDGNSKHLFGFGAVSGGNIYYQRGTADFGAETISTVKFDAATHKWW